MVCDLGPYEIENLRCLLKNILAVVLNNTAEPDDDEYWKK